MSEQVKPLRRKKGPCWWVRQGAPEPGWRGVALNPPSLLSTASCTSFIVNAVSTGSFANSLNKTSEQGGGQRPWPSMTASALPPSSPPSLFSVSFSLHYSD